MADPVLSNWSDDQLIDFLSKPKPLTTADRLTDVAKGSGRGLEDFGIWSAGFPGDVQNMAQVGAAKMMGLQPGATERLQAQTGSRGMLPTSTDIQNTVEKYTGAPLYVPHTPEGQMARSIFSYLPAALPGPVATLPARAVRNAIVPALASDYVGAKLQGTPLEAPGRVATALAAPTIAGKLISPLPINAQRLGYVNTLAQEGMPLTAGDVTGRKALQVGESALGTIPFAGQRFQNIKEGQRAKFVDAALGRILPQDDQQWVRAARGASAERARLTGEPDALRGVSDQEVLGMRGDTNLATPETLAVGKQYAGQTLESGKAGTVIKFTPKQEQQILDWKQRILASGLPDADQQSLEQMARNYVRSHVTGKPGEPAQLKGGPYLEMTQHDSDLSAMGRGDEPKAKYARELRSIIEEARRDSAFARGTREGTGRRQAYEDINEGRRAYGDFLALENAAGKGEGGTFSPAQLKSSLQSQNRQAYNRGRGDLRDLAEAGDVVMKPVPDSGTAGRVYAQSIPHAAAATIVGAAEGQAPLTWAGLAMGAAPPIAGRVLMHPLTQWWLSNYRNPSAGGFWDEMSRVATPVRHALRSEGNERVSRLLAAEEATQPYREPKALPPPQ